MQTNRSIEAQTDWLTFLTGEALVFGLLGKALYVYPDRAWIQSLADERVFDESPLGSGQADVVAGLALLQAWMKESQGGMPDEAFDALRADYTSLFIGPGKVVAPPWESVYFNDSRMVFQEQTLEVRTWYRRYGLEAENLYREPDDHIGLELAFLAHLAKLGVEALRRRDESSFADHVSSQHDFLSQHILTWAPTWCGQVADQAKTDFYRGVALLTRGTLLSVAAMLDGRPMKA